MALPHPALVALAAGRDPTGVPGTDDGLFASAVDHGMHGLLWSWVREHEPDYSERIRLAGVDAATRQRHRRLWETAERVRAALAAIDVDVAVLKGVAAERRWYDRPGERPCEDVDVLIDPAALSRAGEVVDALEPSHPLRQEVAQLAPRGAMQSVNLHVDGVSVDLHFDLLKLGFPMRQGDLVWERMRCVSTPDGSSVRAPDAAVSLVHFLVHANKDCFPRLLGYTDVARVMRDPDLDWSFVERFARDEGLHTIVRCSLATVTDTLGLPAPPLRGRGHGRAAIWRVAWPERVTLLGSAGTARSRRQEVLPFLVRGRELDALRGAARVLFPPAAAVAVQYPDLPGPYAWRLARGRVQTWRARRAALDARQQLSLHTAAAAHDPAVTARLLRARAQSLPLWLDVTGRSMGWSIPDGGRVLVEAGGSPRRGEVWAFCNDAGDVVVHRCRGRAAGRYRFQGDARVRPDAPVTEEQLIGRVVDVAPRRSRLRWSPAAGALQRIPRTAVARTVRGMRALRRGPAR